MISLLADEVLISDMLAEELEIAAESFWKRALEISDGSLRRKQGLARLNKP